MANGRNRGKRAATQSRDGDRFVALPWVVLDSDAYQRLSHPARSLLLEICRQYDFDNNGRLLASRARLAKRGWRSADVIQRAKDELLAAGFIHETVKGQRPNKAAWYALTFHTLDRLPGYDDGALESFERSAYRKNVSLSPSRGTGSPPIVPSHGTEKALPVPSHGTIRPEKRRLSVPSHGHHLDMPSVGSFSAGSDNGGHALEAGAAAPQREPDTAADLPGAVMAPTWARVGHARNRGHRLAVVARLAAERGIALGEPVGSLH